MKDIRIITKYGVVHARVNEDWVSNIDNHRILQACIEKACEDKNKKDK